MSYREKRVSERIACHLDATVIADARIYDGFIKNISESGLEYSIASPIPHEVWRNYVFGLVANNLTAIMATLEEVAFQRMDVRIAEFIMKLSKTSDNGIKITHQDIAMELGTSREVVSRILKHFEYDNLITLQRGMITLNDIDKFRKKAAQEKF